jgi:hypothetical protein
MNTLYTSVSSKKLFMSQNYLYNKKLYYDGVI